MNNKKGFIRAFCGARLDDGADLETVMGSPIRFTASTEGVKRDGFDLLIGGGEFENFHRNPVILWGHDYHGTRLPIGRAADLDVQDGAINVDISFDQADPFAVQVERKYRTGYLNAVSLGWNTIETERVGADFTITRWDLLDISAVPVPGDPDALMQRGEAGIRSMAGDLRDLLEGIQDFPIEDLTGEEDSPGENEEGLSGEDDSPIRSEDDPNSESVVWAGVSTAMVGVFDGRSTLEDDGRKSVYILLERLYKKLGRVAPEFLPLATVTSLGKEEIRGLFLADEDLSVLFPDPQDPQADPSIDGLRGLVDVLATFTDKEG